MTGRRMGRGGGGGGGGDCGEPGSCGRRGGLIRVHAGRDVGGHGAVSGRGRGWRVLGMMSMAARQSVRALMALQAVVCEMWWKQSADGQKQIPG